jgi:hypothetical protein
VRAIQFRIAIQNARANLKKNNSSIVVHKYIREHMERISSLIINVPTAEYANRPNHLKSAQEYDDTYQYSEFLKGYGFHDKFISRRFGNCGELSILLYLLKKTLGFHKK